MPDRLRPLFLMFYAPARGMAEVRDRAPLGFAALLAFLTHGAYLMFVLWPYVPREGGAVLAGGVVFTVGWKVLSSLLFTTILLVPVFIFVANIVERRASFGMTLRQEYAPVASAVLYARALASLFALPFVALLRGVGTTEELYYQQLTKMLESLARQGGQSMEEVMAIRPFLLADSFASTVMLPFLVLWLLVAVREALRLSWGRALLVVCGSALAMIPLTMVFGPVFEWVFASPFLLLLLFFMLRGYFAEVMSGQRARASFRRNLEAATLNPADASAHYNLGLIHLQRKELEEARARFGRAVEIDPEEVDAHYQLGRIAREEGRLAEAIEHFSQVVTRDPSHSLHEIWREIGATYVAAGQFDDAQDALERFLEHRTNDPEGLYLMGRAQAGQGHAAEAARWMQRCIEAVQTAPAYKYRADKRWLNEAQQFLRTQA